MDNYDLFMIVDIFVVFLIFIGALIWRYYTKPINFTFQGEKFHIDYEDRKCEVISFEGGKTFRKVGTNWFRENQGNLAEWTYAKKGHKSWLKN